MLILNEIKHWISSKDTIAYEMNAVQAHCQCEPTKEKSFAFFLYFLLVLRDNLFEDIKIDLFTGWPELEPQAMISIEKSVF